MSKYMFSESAGLLCYVEGNRYEVVNGAWTGIRNGDLFEVCYHHEGHPENTIKVVDDWEEIDPNIKSKDWQEAWYYSQRGHVYEKVEFKTYFDGWDDDIAF